jgi:hypothetical protein
MARQEDGVKGVVGGWAGARSTVWLGCRRLATGCFNKNGSCRHSDKCAYLHTVKQSDAQQKLNEILATALATQIKETAEIRNEVIELKLKVQHLENYIQTNKVSPKEKKAVEGFEKATENIFEHDEIDQNDTTEVEELFDCSKCNYSCKKNSTLMKHMNTKHVVKADDTCSTRSTVSITSSREKDSSEQLIKSSKFFCDECDYGCMSRKVLKKHKVKHQSTTVTAESTSDPENGIDCNCTEDSVCDECLDYWVRKGSNNQNE